MSKLYKSKDNLEAINYISVNTNYIFDFNYQKSSLIELLNVLRRNDAASAKIKKRLLEKALETLGLNNLPEAGRVMPFFHCYGGDFYVTFLYNSISSFTPWDLILANNFGELMPLFLQIYEILKKPIFNNTSATIGNFNVFNHQSHNELENTYSKKYQCLEYGEEELSDISDRNAELQWEESIDNSTCENNKVYKQKKNSQNRYVAIRKSTTSTKKNGTKNKSITEAIQMSSSLPNLDNNLMTHPYLTRNRKNKSMNLSKKI